MVPPLPWYPRCVGSSFLLREIDPQPTFAQRPVVKVVINSACPPFGDSSLIAPRPLLTLGQVVATPGCLEMLSECGQTPDEFLARHVKGDWGELDEEDRQANDDALIDGSRVLSAYRAKNGKKIWIITEHDRSSTCCLLPSEY